MNRIFIIASCLLMCICSVANAKFKWGGHKLYAGNSSLVHIGDRSYRLYRPDNLPSKNVPLLLALHGGFGNAESFEKVLGMNKIADKYGFVIAYPNGVEGAALFMKNRRMWNSGNCCGVAARENVDDVGFLTNVISDIASKYPIDKDRVYIAGHSNGGMMSYRFACERPDLITAVVSVAGQLTANSCKNYGSVDALQIHGDADEVVPPQGGVATKRRTTNIKYRSIEETKREIEGKGGRLFVEKLAGVGHKLKDINNSIENKHRISLAEMIISFLKDKSKNQLGFTRY